MVNAQQWLDRNYPQQQRNNIEEIAQPILENEEYELIIELEGNLTIEGFSNLKHVCLMQDKLDRVRIIDCPQLKKLQLENNRITTLEIINCPRVNYLDCSNNQLSELPTGLNPESLSILYITSNHLLGDLTIFSRFINLRNLCVGNNSNLSGSLRELSDLEELRELNVTQTRIDSGLEYLPESLDCFDFHYTQFNNYCNSRGFSQLVRRYSEENGHYNDYQAWRENNEERIEQLKQEELQAQIQIPPRR